MQRLNRRSFVKTVGAAGTVLMPALVSGAPNEQVGVGMIGVGGRGSFLLKNLLEIPGVRIVAICDIDEAHLSSAVGAVTAAGQPAPATYKEWKRLLEDKSVAAVVSALPCDLHAAAYLDVIAAGRDLYAEKPMALTAADCDRVVDAAETSKQVVQLGFQRRADPRFVETMQQVHSGELGQLIEGRILWSVAWGPQLGWFGDRKRSGDWMVEQAVHNWDVLNWANRGVPARAVGLGRNNLFRDEQPDRNVHDYYSAVVEYPNGVLVNIMHSWMSPEGFSEEYTRLVGTVGGVDFNTGTFTYRRALKRPDRVAYTKTGEINNTLLALTAFINSVKKRTAPIADVRAGRDAVLACLLVREAVYTRRMVSVTDLRA